MLGAYRVMRVLDERPIEPCFTLKSISGALCLISVLLAWSPAKAQQNPLGNFLGGIIAQGMVQNAQNQWQALPQPRQGCLFDSLARNGLNVNNLIRHGIGPDDARLQHLNYPCQQLQNEHDDRIEAEAKAEEDRIAEEQRIKAEAEQAERDAEKKRISELKKIVLKTNISCQISVQGKQISSYCDQALVRINSPQTVISIKDAISNKLTVADLKTIEIERPEALARREEMLATYKHMAAVNAPSIDCTSFKEPKDKPICSSYELSFLDDLQSQYYQKAKVLETKNDVKKRKSEFDSAVRNCKIDPYCLKETYIAAVNAWATFLATKNITVAPYEQTVQERRDTENAAQAIDDNAVKLKAEQAEAERQRQASIAEAERVKREQIVLKLKQEQEAAALQVKLKQAELERLEQEKKEKIAKIRTAWVNAANDLTTNEGSDLIKLCENSIYAADRIANASTIKDRKAIRESNKIECRCAASAMLAGKGTDSDPTTELSTFLKAETATNTPSGFVQAQIDCHQNLSADVFEGWTKD